MVLINSFVFFVNSCRSSLLNVETSMSVDSVSGDASHNADEYTRFWTIWIARFQILAKVCQLRARSPCNRPSYVGRHMIRDVFCT